MDTVRLNRPANKALCDYLDRSALAAPATHASFFADDGEDALPSMFQRPLAATSASKPRTINRRGRFSPYVIILFLLGVAPLQATLLTSGIAANEQGAMEQVLVVAKRSAAELLSVPAAEAAIHSHSQSLASFEDRGWSQVVDSFKLLLAEQNASAMKQAESDRLLRQLEAWVNASAQKPAKVDGTCALNCWKTVLSSNK